MKKIKIKFVDFWDKFDVSDNFWVDLLKEKYAVEISDKPDYIFFSCFGKEHLKYKSIRIFVIAENIRPDFNISDYVIGNDWMAFEDRYIRYPYYLYGEKYYRYALNKKNGYLDYKDKFCNFIYSNEHGDEIRENFLKSLSNYKRVDSGGRYLNNIHKQVVDKFEFQKRYKFSIAFENSRENGYTTEKIVDAFAAQIGRASCRERVYVLV